MATQSGFPVYCTRLEEVMTRETLTALLKCWFVRYLDRTSCGVVTTGNLSHVMLSKT